jgi:hypothetical protein
MYAMLHAADSSLVDDITFIHALKHAWVMKPKPILRSKPALPPAMISTATVLSPRDGTSSSKPKLDALLNDSFEQGEKLNRYSHFYFVKLIVA